MRKFWVLCGKKQHNILSLKIVGFVVTIFLFCFVLQKKQNRFSGITRYGKGFANRQIANEQSNELKHLPV